MVLTVMAWVVLGLVAGFVAGTVVNGAGRGPFVNTAVGVGGAVIGGLGFQLIGLPGFDGMNIYSLLVATVGATALLGVSRAISHIFR